MKLYLMSGPRSGSTSFAEYLNSHPDISFTKKEFFHNNKVKLHPVYSRLLPQYYLNSMLKQEFQNETSIYYGCKIMYYQIEKNVGSMKRIINRKDTIIHLIRKNTFAQYVSLKESMISRIWHSRKSKETRPEEPLVIDLNDMKCFIEIVNKRKERYSRMFPDVITIEYEEYLKDQENIIQSVTKQLGLKDFYPETTIKKSRSVPYHERIKNYKEVQSLLQSIGFDNYLRMES